MFDKAKHWFSRRRSKESIQAKLEELRKRAPAPLFWLFGKTQTGKTSIIKLLTGAEAAEIGLGFKPCTRFSREYVFPTTEAPLLSFLDTRGLDEPGYDPADDLAGFNNLAQVVVVTVKVLDHAQENVVNHLRTIREAGRQRPVVLALTCLHEAYPQQQHLQPYPFTKEASFENEPAPGFQDLARSVADQKARFSGLVDVVVPIDLTRPEEGFGEPAYGGQQLKKAIIDVLPAAYRQSLLRLEQGTKELQDLYARAAIPHILGYSSLAATAGAIPIPWLDLLILPGIQTQMIHHLARLYGQPLSGARFLELAGTLGMGILVRQGIRELVKFIPVVGSVAGGALAGASTFALGKAFCYYYGAVHQGHVPRPEDLKHYYRDQLAQAQELWKATSAGQQTAAE